MTKIYAGSDHAGFGLRRRLVDSLRSRGCAVEDLGPATDASCDYPQLAAAVAIAALEDEESRPKNLRQPPATTDVQQQ